MPTDTGGRSPSSGWPRSTARLPPDRTAELLPQGTIRPAIHTALRSVARRRPFPFDPIGSVMLDSLRVRSLLRLASTDRGQKWLGRILVLVAVVLLGWTIYLGSVLRGQVEVRDWQIAWVGLDLMQVTGLAVSGVLLARRQRLLCPVAAATGTLLAVDAWFDVTTTQGGTPWVLAVLMAVTIQLPMAYLMARLSKLALDWPPTGPDH